jgi:hypothetical protein
MSLRIKWVWVWVLLSCVPDIGVAAPPLADWNFTTGTHGWIGNPRVRPVSSTAGGLVVRSVG